MSAPRHHQVLFARGGEMFSDNLRWLHDGPYDHEEPPEAIAELHRIMELPASTNAQPAHDRHHRNHNPKETI